MFQPVDTKIDFPEAEKRVLAFWKEHAIFEQSLELRKDAPRFVFYEGPPTANGTPHNGHVLTRVIKDVFPRYKTMRGYLSNRKAGWDTHGLPVEVEVEKELGIHGKEAIEEYGVEAFTRKCIASVFRYTDVWAEFTERIGFWVNLEEAYVTFHKAYVESVWWALSELFKKGLLYQGHKVVWWWPQGGTALSAAEVGQGYKTVDDPSVTARFAVKGEENTSFLAWTTTPWTLPSNCALTVNPNLEYVYATQNEETLIVAKALADTVLGEGEYDIVKTVVGRELLGIQYEPLFHFKTPEGGRAWEVIPGDFVTTSAGTGVVHTAPAYGEDDYRVANAEGIGMLKMVGANGQFVAEAAPFTGRFCKEADKDIIRALKAEGKVYSSATVRHEYPYCWRADDDPLIQFARPAWFIRTTEVIERTKEINQKINWMPEHIKDGRFGNWINNNVDWALSRERFWGTPLNIWECPSCDHRAAPSSVEEIESLNPEAFTAFRDAQRNDPTINEHLIVHKPWIDDVTFPCAECGQTMKRVTEVIDCWFDSGCMPFAQWGYPHQNSEQFKDAFPADFISEAIDQTRGWFYSLLMVSTLLFDQDEEVHPYKNCIVLGHVCDKKGKKESKSKGNYTPPDGVLDSSGADAMRWYFYASSPPVNNTRYSADAVRQGQQEFLLKLRNVYSFFVIYANIDGFNPNDQSRRPVAERSLLDRWMISELNLTVEAVTEHMDNFRVYDATQHIIELTDALSNWYVRRSRDRFWSSTADQDKWDAYHTLYESLCTLCTMSAPFVPFITEDIYQNLILSVAPKERQSVHLSDWPTLQEGAIDRGLSEEMRAVREIVSLGLATRATHKIKVRQPLQQAEVILGHVGLTQRITQYKDLIAEELNVKQVIFTQDAAGRVQYTVKPNYRALGPVFGKRMPVVRQAIDATDSDVLRKAIAQTGSYNLTLPDGETVTLDSDLVQVQVIAEEGFAAAGGSVGVVVLNTSLDDELINEGIAREVVNRIQTLRKQQDLPYTARIQVRLGSTEAITSACAQWRSHIERETLSVELLLETCDSGVEEDSLSIDGVPAWLSIQVRND